MSRLLPAVLLAAAVARADAPAPRPRPEVHIGAPSLLEGKRTVQEMQKRLMVSANAYRACYESAWKANPSLEGTIELVVMVKPDGSVGRAEVNDDRVRSAPLSRCLQLRLRGLKLDPAAESAVFAVRFTFSVSG